MAQDKELEAIQKVIKQAVASEELLNIYGNGFICYNSTADIVIILQKNQKAVSLINLSYTTAKTLSEKLAQIIRDFEKTTGNTIMTINVVDAKMKEQSKNVKLQ